MEKIQNIYDNQKFFNDYIDMRENQFNANDLLEIPMIKSMLPDLQGKSVLDLGCGSGGMSKYFVEKGASRVLALDISKNMIMLAKETNSDDKIEFKVLSMEQISKIKEKFDVVFSSLAFHYVEDFQKLIKDISKLLKPNGMLLFSQEHPVATAVILQGAMKNKIDINGKKYFLLSDYNNNGKRLLNWNVDGVIKYHRNFTCIINSLINAGLNIVELQESQPFEKAVEKVEKYKYQKDKPYFLFVKAIKD